MNPSHEACFCLAELGFLGTSCRSGTPLVTTLADPSSAGFPGPGAFPLTQLARGESACVYRCDLDEACAGLIGSMGLSETARISMCRMGDPCVVRVFDGCGGSCRIGLRREISRRIMVRPLGE